MKYSLERINEVAATMKIECDFPPNIADIDKVIPGVYRNAIVRHIFFTYGDTIYNPSGAVIPVWLLAHEAVHSLQQIELPVAEWWKLYLKDTKFRFEQELEAHQVEYAVYLRQGFSRAFRRRYLVQISERLAGPLYGRITNKKIVKAMIVEGEADVLDNAV